MKTILVVPTSSTDWHYLDSIAQKINESKRGEVLFLIDRENKTINHLAGNSAVDCIYIGSSEFLQNQINHVPPLSRRAQKRTFSFFKKLSARLSKSSVFIPIKKIIIGLFLKTHFNSILAFVREHRIRLKNARALKKQESKILAIFSQLQPTSILLSGDRGLGYVPPILSASRKLNISTIIYPTPVSSVFADDLAVSRRDPKFLLLNISQNDLAIKFGSINILGAPLVFFLEEQHIL